jgi:Asp/Glu/hydantoin racemase
VRIGGGPLTALAFGLQPQSDIPLVVPVVAAAEAADRRQLVRVSSAAQPSRTPAWSHPPSAGRMAPLT